MKKVESRYKKAIANYLNAAETDIFLYWKGRVALYALLQAMGVGAGDEVIIPAFTCVVVPNAIKYLGAKPVYVDICPDTYNVNVDLIETAITEKTKVIICQNTFGLSSHLEQLTDIARHHHLYTIEDCTHGFGGTFHGKPNGSYCDAAFYSTQWNKPFSTGIGGFAWVSNCELHCKIQQVNEKLESTSIKDAISLSILYFIREKILTDKRYWRMVKCYRWLSKHKLVQGSSSGTEIETNLMPDHYFKAISNTQMRKGYHNLQKLNTQLQLRKKNARIYNDYLAQKGKTTVPENCFDDHSFLKFPLLVQHRDEVLKLAESTQIPLGEWFCSPIHPVMENWEQWDFSGENCPESLRLSRLMINLPTDVKNITPILRFIDSIEEWIV